MPTRYGAQALSCFRMIAVVLAMSLVAGCSESPIDGALGYEQRFHFADGQAAGWIGGFADYPSDAANTGYEMVFEVRDLPAAVGSGKALFLSSHNRSDDVFMFLKRRLDGLEPNTAYDVVLRTTLASDAPSGCAGIGGAPGESVFLKVGAVTDEPKVIDVEGFYTFTADKGQQAQGGQDAVVVGTVANGDACVDRPEYRLIDRDNADQPLRVRTGADGSFWVFVGTDSGYEGLTALYFTRIEVVVGKG